jgi:hypothetical protein
VVPSLRLSGYTNQGTALALLALIAYPFIWLLLLPFRVVGIAVHGALDLVAALIFLPARVLRAV